MMLPFTAVLVVCCLSSTLASFVREPPSIDEPRADQIPPRYFIDGSTFELPCKSSKGQPKPINYIWKFNGKTLELYHQDVTITGDGIKIENAHFDRAGSYQCQASNMYGTSLSQLFTLELAELGSFPADKAIQTFHGGIGRHLVVKRLRLPSVPTPAYTWKKVRNVDDESPMNLNRNRRIVQDREGNLHFTYLKESDIPSGEYKIYKVDIFNDIKDNTAGGSYTEIIKKADPPAGDLPPQLVYPEPATFNVPTKVLEGEKMEIQCIFSGYPEVQVTWTGPTFGVLLEGDTVLQVDKMTKEAEGAFTCTGTNYKGGQSQHTINVEMETIPKFSANGRPAGQTLSEGDTAVFVCQTTAETNPPATVNFMVNGELIKDFGDRTTVVDIDLGKKLTIIEVQRDKDIKVIQCKAENKHKTLYADAPLNVLMRTTLTSQSADQTLEANTTQVILTCAATTDPGTPLTWAWTRDNRPIDFYEDPRLEEAGSRLTVNLAYLAPDQIARYSGEYACNASNGYSSEIGTIVLTYNQGSGSTGDPPRAENGSQFWIIVVAAVVGCVAVLVGVAWYVKRRKNNSTERDQSQQTMPARTKSDRRSKADVPEHEYMEITEPEYLQLVSNDQSQDVSTNGTASDQSRTRGQLPDGYMDMGEPHYLKPTPRHISDPADQSSTNHQYDSLQQHL